MLRTVAEAVIASVSTGDAGLHEDPVTVRSGFGAGVPMTWNSATCPPGAPLLLVMLSPTRAVTGIVTLFPVAGSNVYCFAGTRLLRPVALCSRPSTWMVWVRAAQIGSGFSLTTTDVMSA